MDAPGGMVQSSIGYQYDSIAPGSIRLVKLLPGSSQDPIVCELMTTELADDISYEAISYVWGDTSQVRTIECSGKQLNITQSLHNVLSRVRYQTTPRTLWVDAICINQQDLTERSQQVQIMGTIYARAARVIIYLGNDENKSGPVVAQMVGQRNSLKSLSEIQTNAIADLLKCAWFTRVWVIQEAALATSPYLQWGEIEIEWRVLVQLLDIIGSHRIAVGDLWHKVGYEWNLWLAHLAYDPPDTRLLHLVQLLYAARGHSATDPRDHVFAFLGHPANMLQGSALLRAEYGAPVPEIFKKVTIDLLLSMKTLDILSYVTHNEIIDSNPARSSWIPEWDHLPCTSDGFQIRVFPFPESKIFKDRNMDHSQVVFALEENDNVLVLKGTCIDTVEWQSETIIYTMISPGLWATSHKIHPLEEAWLGLRQHYLSKGYNGDILKLFSLLLVSGQAEKHEVERRGSAHSANFDAWRLEHSKHQSAQSENSFFDGIPLSEEPSTDGDWGTFVSDAFQSCNGRRIFCTTNGDLGVGPMAMRPGDVCVSLHGARTPFVLRPSGNTHLLVGEAYLHELVYHGDSFWTEPPGQQVFRLR